MESCLRSSTGGVVRVLVFSLCSPTTVPTFHFSQKPDPKISRVLFPKPATVFYFLFRISAVVFVSWFLQYNTAFTYISSMSVLTVDQFKMALPEKVKKSINQELIDQINTTLADPDMYETYRDNLLSYTKVMADGRFKVTDYVSAVKYVSHKVMGATNIEAYTKTFPDKYQRFVSNGVQPKDIASYVTAYNKSKLVNLIMEQTLVPAWVLNQDLYQKALNKQAELMMTARSEKVQSDAAAHLMNALKPPEASKIELDVNIKEDSSIAALRASTLELARQQRLMVQAGAMNAQQIAHSKLSAVVDVEAKEI